MSAVLGKRIEDIGEFVRVAKGLLPEKALAYALRHLARLELERWMQGARLACEMLDQAA
jgi:hypothetical protein